MPTFDEVRSSALALPEAEEHVTWGTKVNYRVRNRVFVIGAEGADRVSVKARPGAQAELPDFDPETFASAPYMDRFGWVTVNLARVVPAMIEGLWREAWRSTAPARLRGRVP